MQINMTIFITIISLLFCLHCVFGLPLIKCGKQRFDLQSIKPSNNPDEILLYVSSLPISDADLEEKTETNVWPATERILNKMNCLFHVNVKDFNKHYTLPVPVANDDISIIQIRCPVGIELGSNISDVIPIAELTNVKMLYISCGLTHVDVMMFANLRELMYLDMSVNLLTSIDNRMFDFLPKLMYLNLSGNKITHFSFNLLSRVSHSLKYVDLKYTGAHSRHLFSCDESDGVYFIMRWMDLSWNALDVLPDNAFSCFKNITSIFINNNSIPMTIGQNVFRGLNNLIELHMSSSKIHQSDIPAISNRAINLRFLHLDNNNINSLKGSFPNLRIANMRRNNISRIGNETFKHCTRLIVLNLEYNKISEIHPNAFRQLYIIKELGLSHNKLQVFDDRWLLNLKLLQYLHLADNSLTSLDFGRFIYHGYNLKSLWKHQNKSKINMQVIKMKQFHTRQKLAYFDAGFNQISRISPDFFYSYTYLQIIYLNDNQIRHIPPKIFTKLKFLKVLSLKNNKIVRIPRGVLTNSPIIKLFLHFNSIRQLPCDMLFHSAINESGVCNKHLRLLSLQHNHIDARVFCLVRQSCFLVALGLNSNNIATIPPRSLVNLHHLTILHLSQNRLTNIKPSEFYNLSNLRKLTLNDNSFTKSCDLVPLANWIKSHKNIVENARNISCSDEDDHQMRLMDIPADLDCSLTILDTKYIIAISVIALSAFAVTILTIMFRMELSVLIYTKTGWRLKRCYDDGVRKHYQITIFHSEDDTNIAYKHFVPTLEKFFTVYWHARDLNPAMDFLTSVERAMTTSERVVIIVTRNFVADCRCVAVFHAIHDMVVEKLVNVVLVMADDEVIRCRHILPDRLRSYVRTCQYLSLARRLFWKKLFFKLPKIAVERVDFDSLVIPEFDFSNKPSLDTAIDNNT